MVILGKTVQVRAIDVITELEIYLWRIKIRVRGSFLVIKHSLDRQSEYWQTMLLTAVSGRKIWVWNSQQLTEQVTQNIRQDENITDLQQQIEEM